MRDRVLLGELPFVGFDLLGEGNSQLALALLSLLELSAKTLDLVGGLLPIRLEGVR